MGDLPRPDLERVRDGVTQPVVAFMGHDDSLDFLPRCGQVCPNPSHVPGRLADDAVRGAPAFQFHDNERVRGGIDAEKVRPAGSSL